jgi:DNA-binding GntR family transcriptional regulator
VRGFKPRTQSPAPERTPVGTRAYNELRRQILHGVLPAGTILAEAETAELLGVSRTPLREAMRELLSEGLCEEGPRRQMLVASGSPDIDREVALLQPVLERLASRQAAQRHRDCDLDELRLTEIRARRAIELGDLNAYLDCDDDFHLCIARMAGPMLIEDAVRRLRALARLSACARALSPELVRSAAAQHEAIIAALESADPDLAETAMDEHLRTIAKALASGPPGRR